jgi:hypothetical protein
MRARPTLLVLALPLLATAACFSSQSAAPDAAADDASTVDASLEGAPPEASLDVATTPDVASSADAPADTGTDASDATLPTDAPVDAPAPPVDGCASCNGTCAAGRCIELVSPGQGSATGMAVDSAFAYWCTGNGSVLKAPLTGVPDGGSPTTLVSGLDFPNAVAVDSQAVYIADYSAGTIVSIPLDGVPDGGAPTTLVSGLSSPAGVAVDSTTIYITCNDDTVRTAPIGGGTATLFASDTGGPNGAWLFGGNLYWIDVNGGAIQVAPASGLPDGSAPTTVLTVGGTPHHVAVDATSIYWLAGTAGVIESAPITGLPDGGAPTPIATGQNAPDALAVDSAWVYWADNGGAGDVFRASK